MKRVLFMAGLLVSAFLVLPANAGTIDLSPASSTIASGDTFDLDFRVSGDTALSVTTRLGFAAEYDSAVITPTAVTFGSFFTGIFSTTSVSTNPSGGTDESIEMLVEDGFLIRTILTDVLFATITFQGVAPGFSEISAFRNRQSGCCAGDGFFDPDDGMAEVTVSASVIPLPAALPLLVSGLAGLGVIGWRRRKAA